MLRAIETKDYAKVTAPSTFGKPARLEWLAIKQLVIDPEYQREITLQGRNNVRRIATAFNWSMFAPVIVAAAGSNKFAIVDGQHRTTAAALCGVDKVPCAIIEAVRGEQAAAFKAINGNVTKLSSIQLHHASLAAGETKAKRIAAVCAKAGVAICRYPKPSSAIPEKETMAVVAIARLVDRYGDVAVTDALHAITLAGGGYPGNLQGPIIVAFTEVLHDNKAWRGARLKAALDEVYPDEMLAAARAKAAQTRGTGAAVHLKTALLSHLQRHFGAQGRAA